MFRRQDGLSSLGEWVRKATLLLGAGVATMLRSAQSEVRILVGSRDFSLFQNFRNCSGTHPASYSVGTEVISRK
jgi:hypothetical protein